MIQLSDNRKIIMTEDNRCILRGKKETHLILTTLGEKSRSKIRVFSSASNVLSCEQRIYITPEVQELYNIDNNYYDKNKMPKLVLKTVKCTYNIED